MLFDRNGNRKYLTAGERDAFIEAAKSFPPHVETLALTLVLTGARISEALALRVSSIDYSAGAIVFETLKRRRKGVYRAVPVPEALLLLLREVHDGLGPDERLWPLGRTAAWMQVKEVMSRAGIPPARAMPRALRHTFAVYGLTTAGVPLNLMQKWLGHARIETTALYANALGEEERTIAERMWAKWSARSNREMLRRIGAQLAGWQLGTTVYFEKLVRDPETGVELDMKCGASGFLGEGPRMFVRLGDVSAILSHEDAKEFCKAVEQVARYFSYSDQP